MQFTRREENLVKSRKTALGAFRKKVEKNRYSEPPPPPPSPIHCGMSASCDCQLCSRTRSTRPPRTARLVLLGQGGEGGGGMQWIQPADSRHDICCPSNVVDLWAPWVEGRSPWRCMRDAGDAMAAGDDGAMGLRRADGGGLVVEIQDGHCCSGGCFCPCNFRATAGGAGGEERNGRNKGLRNA